MVGRFRLLVVGLLLASLQQRCDAKMYNLTCFDKPFSLASERYLINGTHYIGMLASIETLDPETGLCDGKLTQVAMESMEAVELLAHLVDQLNANGSLLPAGVKLGLMAFDDYYSESYTAGQAVQLFTERAKGSTLIAVFCCSMIAGLVQVSPMLNAYRIPMISHSPTLDVLSAVTLNSKRPSLLLQLAPSLRGRIRAIVELLDRMSWDYIIVLYADNDYGMNSFRLFEKLLRATNVCVAFSAPFTESNLAEIAHLIETKKSARVIVLLAPSRIPIKVFAEAFRIATKEYVWIKMSTWDWSGATREEMVLFQTAVEIRHSLPVPTALTGFLRDPSYWKRMEERNPWFQSYSGACLCLWMPSDRRCKEVAGGEVNRCGEYKYLWMVQDAVAVIVSALRGYNAAGLSVRSIDFDLFYQFLVNVSFSGASGNIRFVQGEVLSFYSIVQLRWTESGVVQNDVGHWDERSLALTIHEEAFRWKDNVIPPSTCKRQCEPRESVLLGESPCCVRCEPCELHELAVNSTCTTCPLRWWPVGDVCVPLVPKLLEMSSALGIVIVLCSILGVVMVVLTAALYVHYREARLIKSSCRETSAVALAGIMLQFIAPLFLLLPPDPTICLLRRVSFHLPFTMIYGPTLVKCVKIFRIFWMGQRSKQLPRFVSVKAQMFVIAAILLVETILLVVSLRVYPPEAADIMPLKLDPIVEAVCSENVNSFILAFGVNVVLLLLSATFAMKTRKLPDNFNESQQIAFCVNTVLLMCAVFVPISFVLTRSESRGAVIFACEHGSALMTLALLFAPKMYAIHFQKEEDGADDTEMAGRRASTRVAPFKLPTPRIMAI